MSRKTRKLIWSAPLVAVLAVAGALAIFVALSPQEAAAHEAVMHGAPGPVTGLTAAQAADDPATGEPEGRTQITLTWMTPAAGMGDPATGYRIDYSDDTRVWVNLMGGESGSAALAETMADNNCVADAAAGLRCYTDTSLKPGMERHYRVFAVNALGTSPVSTGPTYVTATTLPYANPSPVRGLTATTHHVDQIVLNWQPPTDTGGAEIEWYCLALAETEGTIPNLTEIATQTTEDACYSATEATTGDVAFASAPTTIVVDSDMTSYTQGMLTTPNVISLYYRVYAVTDSNGDQVVGETPTGRRIAMAASNIANGRTVARLPTIDTSVTATPRAVTNLRWVASGTATGNVPDETLTSPVLRLYWTLPSNYPPAPVGAITTENPDLRLNWSIEVSRYDSAATDPLLRWVVEDGITLPNDSPTQWQSEDDEVDELLTARQQYRVRYVNNAGTEDNDDDDADGTESRFSVPQLTVEVFVLGDLAQISESTSNAGIGLRFAYNEIYPDVWLDLIWNEEENGNGDVPTGFEIDVTEATTIDKNTVWTPVRNQPIDLGATRQYTHKGVIPGKQYTYRVFPEFGGNLGIPAVEVASSRGAELPAPVRGLTVTPDPENRQTALVLNWPAVTNNGGHDIMGYLVQVARDDTNNDKTLGATPNWTSLPIPEDADTVAIELRPYSVDKDTTTYTYNGGYFEPADALSGGYVRWFRVFAITVENDGDTGTGGTAIQVGGNQAGDPSSPRSDEGSASPTPTDIAGAEAEPGMTDDPSDPDDPTQIMSPPAPEDLTAEQASDSNLIQPTERGVLLLWNEPEDPAGITGYVIQRKVDDGEFITIGSIGWVGEDDFRERTSFRDSREYIEGEDLYYQVGSRGASTVTPTYAMPVMYPTTHTVHTVVLGKPTMVAAVSNAAGQVTITWQSGMNADSHHVVLYSGAPDYDIVDEEENVTGMSHTFTDVAAGRYAAVVISTLGDDMWDYSLVWVTIP